MATSKKTINKAQLNALVESGMSKAEIAKELGLLVGELNLLGKQLGINWRTRKRKNVIFEFVEDPNQPEGEEKELTNIEL